MEGGHHGARQYPPARESKERRKKPRDGTQRYPPLLKHPYLQTLHASSIHICMPPSIHILNFSTSHPRLRQPLRPHPLAPPVTLIARLPFRTSLLSPPFCTAVTVQFHVQQLHLLRELVPDALQAKRARV